MRTKKEIDQMYSLLERFIEDHKLDSSCECTYDVVSKQGAQFVIGTAVALYWTLGNDDARPFLEMVEFIHSII